MRKGENIFKRKDGRWEGRYIKGYELSGKAKYGFATEKLIKKLKIRFQNVRPQLQAVTPRSNQGHTVGLLFIAMNGCVFEKPKLRNLPM